MRLRRRISSIKIDWREFYVLVSPIKIPKRYGSDIAFGCHYCPKAFYCLARKQCFISMYLGKLPRLALKRKARPVHSLFYSDFSIFGDVFRKVELGIFLDCYQPSAMFQLPTSTVSIISDMLIFLWVLLAITIFISLCLYHYITIGFVAEAVVTN